MKHYHSQVKTIFVTKKKSYVGIEHQNMRRKNDMTTIKFDDYLNSRLSDPQFKAGFEAKSSKLDSAIAIMKARESAKIHEKD